MRPTAQVAVPWFRRPFAWVRRLYDWTLHWAETPYAAPALFVLALVEASFFPVPPDVLLMPLALGRPAKALRYAALCTAGSVLGGLIGWYIGFGLWASLGTAAACPDFGGGALLFDAIPGFTCEKFGVVHGYYQANAGLWLFVSAFTPIPFKVFTIAAGVFHVPLLTLVVASLFGRGARFFLVAGLIRAFGPRVRAFIDRRFELLTLAFTALLLGGFLVVKYAL
jgi:membrane protein YqaA with SNARE-associated domain